MWVCYWLWHSPLFMTLSKKKRFTEHSRAFISHAQSSLGYHHHTWNWSSSELENGPQVFEVFETDETCQPLRSDLKVKKHGEYVLQMVSCNVKASPSLFAVLVTGYNVFARLSLFCKLWSKSISLTKYLPKLGHCSHQQSITFGVEACLANF